MSVWYESGTVGLTNGSTSVTGANTNFKTVGLIAPGDVFVIDGKFYQVASVADDGNLTLSANYAGTTGTAKSYAIIRMQSVSLSNSTLAAQVAQLLANWQGREDEVRVWLAGTAGGGANSDGMYPLTDATSITYQVKCPAQMQQDSDISITQSAANNSAAFSAGEAAREATFSTFIQSLTNTVQMNPSSVDTDLVIPAHYNAYSAGPITISENINITVSDFGSWAIN